MAPQTAIGVLSLQGDFAEHVTALCRTGVSPIEVRRADHLEQTDGLIIPGGESTAMAGLMDSYDLRKPLIDYAQMGKPVWGTCAGLILLADKIIEGCPMPLGLMELAVTRNGYGRQVDSFETDLIFEGVLGGPFHAIFIRAPRVHQVGKGVEVLSRTQDQSIAAVRKGSLLGTAFHPELTNDLRIHQYFVSMVEAVTK